MKMNSTGGCLAKLSALQLNRILQSSFAATFGSAQSNPMADPEDCAILNTAGQIIMATVDMAALVADDPIISGRIAALHAMSDIYASGGDPRWALVELVVNVEHELEQTEKIMTGVLQACLKEGVQVVGGHTTLGAETLVGLTVLGIPKSRVILRKKGAIEGEQLFLSKPLGVGLVGRAAAMNIASNESIAHAIAVMECSNSVASAIAVSTGVSASTDISGFGLLGHLSEMLGPGLGAQLQITSIPVLEGVRHLDSAIYDGGCLRENLIYVEQKRRIKGTVARNDMAILLDPQTNGGLLVSASPSAGAELQANGFSWVGSIAGSEIIELVP